MLSVRSRHSYWIILLSILIITVYLGVLGFIEGFLLAYERNSCRSRISDVPLVSLSLADSPSSVNPERVEVAEADGTEVRMRCAVDANPAAHAVKWFRDVS